MDDKIMAIFGLPGGFEWIIIGLVGLLIFGRKLPDVARNIGRSIIEFKKGMREVKDDIDTRSRIESAGSPKLEQKPEPTVPESASEPAQPASADETSPVAKNECNTSN